MKLLVGAPIRNRTWAIPYWFDAVEVACKAIEVEPAYAFVADRNDPSVELITQECSARDRTVHFVWTHEKDLSDVRQWNNERYMRMAELRNDLLGEVRKLAPDYFLSLDSDIFIHPDSLRSMFEVIEKFDAVGGKCYMSPHRHAPSYAMLPRTALVRPDTDEVLQVDCIMAMKLMKPSAYNVSYGLHYHGEDIFWSLACNAAGLKLGFDGRITNKHVMNPEDALLVDYRCGY